jgi:hypothetical protein
MVMKPEIFQSLGLLIATFRCWGIMPPEYLKSKSPGDMVAKHFGKV